MKDRIHWDLTGSIIRTFFDVYNELGYGFLESVYQNALCVRLRRQGICVEREVPFPMIFDGVEVGFFRADIVCEGRVLVETKAGEKLQPESFQQTLNYLRVTKLSVGLLLHFGPRASFQRIVAGANPRKPAQREAPA